MLAIAKQYKICGILGYAALLGCGAAGPDSPKTPQPVMPVASSSHAAVTPPAPAPTTCGPLDCRLFDTPQEAFAEVLKSSPAILGVGEFHMLKSNQGFKSPTSRFTELFLPMLAGRASDMVIELWVGTGRCVQKEKEVVQRQRPATESHADTTPNELLGLGDKAKSLGILPHALTPSCQDYQRIVEAGDDAIQLMLVLTSQMIAMGARQYFQRNQASATNSMVITYSGAMHNDVHPDHSCGEPCSFGHELDTLTAGRYVEVDLVVPEQIHDGPVWSQRVWYPYFDVKASHPKTTLFHPTPGSFALIFPSTPKS